MDHEKQIEQLLKNNPEGLTIQEIVNKLGNAWNTVTRNLAKLEGAGKIRIRNVGQAKLHYWNHKI